MSDEPSFLASIRAEPDDVTTMLVYADWLDDHGEPEKAEYLRVGLSRRSLEPGDAAAWDAVRGRLRVLRHGLDPCWAATFDEFRCRIWDSRAIKVRIHTYGSAPKKYGHGAVKVAGAEFLFLRRAGWEELGEGTHYYYVRLPEGQPATDPIITIQVPTEAEVERLALEWHREGKGRRCAWAPWLVEYRPCRGGTIADAAEFSFGTNFPWSVTLRWEQGNDRPPRWIRSYSRVAE